MADHVKPERRSQIMRAVKSKNTGPERIVRSAAHRMGLRFRLYRKDLPGKPDLVFAKWKTVIFVNGCFWHRHKGCAKAGIPKSNVQFWKDKFDANVKRDQENCRSLKKLGWKVVVIWQCEVKNIDAATAILKQHFVS